VQPFKPILGLRGFFILMYAAGPPTDLIKRRI